jgi:hypothetical protein
MPIIINSDPRAVCNAWPKAYELFLLNQEIERRLVAQQETKAVTELSTVKNKSRYDILKQEAIEGDNN